MKEDNLTFYDDYVEIELNPLIYNIDSILAAAYMMTDKVYFVLDGDPKKSIKVRMRPRTKMDLKKVASEFNDQVLNYSVYDKQSEKNKGVREEILKRALLTNLAEEDDYIKDEEEILVPWEEKYG